MNTHEIVLITHADSDNGFAMARELLAAGFRVAVTAAYPSSLSRILSGQNADRLIAIAADVEDDAQCAEVLRRAAARFGAPVTRVIDGRGVDCAQPVLLQIAS